MKFIAIAFLILLGNRAMFCQRSLSSMPEIGISGDMAYDSLYYRSGYTCLIESIPKLISPVEVSDGQFDSLLQKIKQLNVKIYAVNIFIPGKLKVVGPSVNEDAILHYVRTVFDRCKKADIKLIVWGSSGSRNIPEGFDRVTAKNQFITLAGKVADVAAEYGIMLALENLNSHETNFITTLKEASEVVRAVNHPNFKLCIDIYHMLVEQEPPQSIVGAKDIAIHCDIAEARDRRPPGTNGEDFLPYLKELKSISYTNKIVMECRWDNLQLQALPARLYLEAQIKQAYR